MASTTARGDLGLGGQGDVQLVIAVRPDDQHGVGVVGEADAGGGHVVGDDQVVLPWPPACRGRSGAAGRGSGAGAGRLGREAHQHLAGAAPGARGRPGCRGWAPGRCPARPSAFLSFWPAIALGRKSATAAAMTMTSASPARAMHGRFHLGRGLDRDDLDAGRGGQADGADQGDLGPPPGQLGGDGVALLARRPVADEADRVDRLPGAAGGHHGRTPPAPDRWPAGPAAEARHPGRGRHDVGRLGQPARTRRRRRPAARSPARPRARPDAAARAMLSTTAGCSHISVCMAGQSSTGGPGGQQGGGEQVRGDPRRVAADQAGRGRGHHDQVGGLAQPGVRDGLRLVPQRAADRLGRQGRERDRPDEPGGAPGHHRAHEGAGVDQAPAHLHGLVGGDAAAHPQHDPPAPQGRSRGVYCSASPLAALVSVVAQHPLAPGRPHPAGGR